ncbi:type I DNA topoisomerase [Candidatus Dependentiae bacterium]|nr:type I DNA topoisomerase [Candidatus Dependentiae bacterium]
MKKLLIVESPGKIKTISKFIGTDFKVMSTIGHIKDLPTNDLGIEIKDQKIDIKYTTIADKDKVINDIVKAAKNSDEIFLAPDPDREGEIIAWHAQQEINKVASEEKIHRITFNEITKSAILNAIAHPSKIDMPKVAAQQARRVLDRWVGYEVSPILWRKLAKGLSAGRVQSVALKIICTRELEIRGFKIEEYWSIDGTFLYGKNHFNATLTHIGSKPAELPNEESTKKILVDLENKTYLIDSIIDKERTKNPVAPFITSTLQQAAANKIGFSVKKTMTVAQSMYEGIPLQDPKSPIALITYMRTDSTRLSQTAIDGAREFIAQTWGNKYLPTKPNFYGKKEGAQDAHEAIRPIDMRLKPEDIKSFVSQDIYKLYSLIWSRALASQMTPAIYAQRQVVIKADKYTFKVTGSTLTFDGFLKAYELDEEDEQEKTIKLPADLKEKENLKLEKITPKQHFTQPPARYSEASLVKELEKQGIGRPSTYATILNTIQSRSYVTLEKKRFTPTDLGMKLTQMLDEAFPKIMDPKFTAHMELDLDKIAQGELDRDKLLLEFWNSFEKDLDNFKGSATGGKKTVEATNILCTECKEKNLVIRLGKTGSFLGCSGFPKCTFTAKFERKEDGSIQIVEKTEETPELLAEICEKCKKPMRKMQGRYGEFIACSGYPECKYIKQSTANFPCPKCKGSIVQRAWRGGKFWGCQNYPKCNFSIFSDIEQTQCLKCNQSPYLLKKTSKDGKVSLTCPRTECKEIIEQ